MRRGLYLLPAAAFGLLACGLFFGLDRDPNLLPSALIDHPVPQFSLPPLAAGDAGLSTADLIGHVSVVNMFASWCVPCREEHAVLNDFARRAKAPVYGIDYKDQRADAAAWIASLGNPYARIAVDAGRVAIDWGVYGVPETFIVDRHGRIRYKHVGPLTAEDVDRTLLPLIARLER
ncbi:MAG TPA: DsbE family thiol:disulfide interchange protein [Stellaceae bacterium]|nr:DsbE family thiol:disulfide interchange protein [Stellaceae bacterium]